MSKRRSFIKSASLLGSAALMPHSGWGLAPQLGSKPTIKPKKLKKGDTIGLVAPGFAIAEDVLQTALDLLGKMGFKTHHTPQILGNHGYFSAADAERARDLNEMFADPRIDGILCARGGYGCTRILHLLDYPMIESNPKALIGFSDITALLQAVHKQTGLVGFHGPVGSTLEDAYGRKYLKKVLVKGKDSLVLKNAKLTSAEDLENPEYDRYTISPGTGRGILAGGSLTLVASMIGTPYEIDFTDKLVFLEDVGEAPYRMDRMLTQLIHGSTFSKAAAIVFGVCKDCDRGKKVDNFTLREVLMDRIAPLNIPSAYGMSFGHVPQNFTLPVGIRAAFDAEAMRLQLLEAAVV